MLLSYGFLAYMETFRRLHLDPYAGALQKEFYMAKRSEKIVYHLLGQLASVNGWATRKEKVSGAWLRCEVWEQAVFAILQVWLFGRRLSIPSTIWQILSRIWPFAFSEISMILLWIWSQTPMEWFIQNHKNFFQWPSEISESRIFLCNYYCEFKLASLNASQGWIKGAKEQWKKIWFKWENMSCGWSHYVIAKKVQKTSSVYANFLKQTYGVLSVNNLG